MATATCRACGREMRLKTDYPRGNFSSEYCCDCVDGCGRLKPREIIRVNMIRRRVNYHRISEEEATEIVDNLMRRIPMWNR